MATRKDLLKAHSFTSRRMIAAFVDRDPDDPTPPLRRVATATFVSILIGVVLLAGTALIGLLRGGMSGDGWKEQNNVILNDTQSGQLFAYVDETVTPVTDVASARLLAAGADASGQPRMVNVKTSALKGVELQERQGIPGAPPQLPQAKDLASFPIRLCSTEPTGRGRYLTMQFGSGEPSSMEYSFIATSSDGTQYLVSGGRSHELYAARGSSTTVAYGLPEVQPGNAWIDALPMGPPIMPPEIRDYGQPAKLAYQGLHIGAIVKVPGTETSPSRYYVQLLDGLASISFLEAMLLRNEHKAESTELPEITEQALVEHTNPVQETVTDPNVPMFEQKAPPGHSGKTDASVCATFSAEDPERVTVSMGQTTPEIDQNRLGTPNSKHVHHITLPPLTGALLRNADASGTDPVTTLLLNGRGYGIPTAGARTALGYGDVEALPVTSGLLRLIPPGLPSGVALDWEHVAPVAQ